MHNTPSKYRDLAMKMIRESANEGILAGSEWRDDLSMINPATTSFLLDEIERLQNVIKLLTQEENDYSRGYSDGFEDAGLGLDEKDEAMSWAIVDRTRERVSFNVEKPKSLRKDQVAIALYARSKV
tara:strand:- start:561 stop:938 length:378 start_codon:yes stop_codon:yes gene_type:complete